MASRSSYGDFFWSRFFWQEACRKSSSPRSCRCNFIRRPPPKRAHYVGPGFGGFRSPATHGSYIAHDGHPELRGCNARSLDPIAPPLSRAPPRPDPAKIKAQELSIEQNVFSAGSAAGGALLRRGLWGRVSARCNRIGRGGHRALCGTHMWPETESPTRKSQVPRSVHCDVLGGVYV